MTKENKNAKARYLYDMLVRKLTLKGMTISTMESCTGGLIASLITDNEGVSNIIKGAFVTYSNEAKIKQGVPSEVIEQYGVYSPETAVAMANACRETYDSDIGIGVTGTLGRIDKRNKSDSINKVYFAIATPDGTFFYDIDVSEYRSRRTKKMSVALAVAHFAHQLIKWD